MKNLIGILIIFIFTGVSSAQNIRQSNKYGNTIAFIDGLVLKSKDKYGIPMFYY